MWVMPVMMRVVTMFGALFASGQLVPVVPGAAGGGGGVRGGRGSRGTEMMMMMVMMVMTSIRWYSRHHVYSLSPAATSSCTDASATPARAATAPAAATTRSTRTASTSRPVSAATTPAHATRRFVPAMREQNEGMLILCVLAEGNRRGNRESKGRKRKRERLCTGEREREEAGGVNKRRQRLMREPWPIREEGGK